MARCRGAIEAEENEREKHLTRPVAGFDLTFSVPKSVSVGVGARRRGDAGGDLSTRTTRRSGTRSATPSSTCSSPARGQRRGAGRRSAASSRPRSITGTRRAGDPHSAHPCRGRQPRPVARTARGARWIHAPCSPYVVALSELHEGVLQDLLTAPARLRLGRTSTAPLPRAPARHRRRVRRADRGVQPPLGRHRSRHERPGRPSSRTTAWPPTDRGRDAAAAPTGHAADPAGQAAPLAAEQTEQWRSVPALSSATTPSPGLTPCATSTRFRRSAPVELARRDAARRRRQSHCTRSHRKRATFTHANVLAEVHRQLHGVRFASPADRLAGRRPHHVTPRAERRPCPLTAAPTDVEAAYRGRGYTTREVLDAETRLLDAGRTHRRPALPSGVAVAANPTAVDEERGSAPIKLAAVHGDRRPPAACSTCWSARPAPARPASLAGSRSVGTAATAQGR